MSADQPVPHASDDEDDDCPLPPQSIEEIRASIERGLADARAGRTIDLETALRRYREMRDEFAARWRRDGDPIT
jgi:hypothetical protein